MKTAIQANKDSGIPIRLIRSVVRTVGKDSIEDIYNHGADGGFSGITYYRDTIAFYRRNRADVIELAHRMADDMGQDMISMIAGFNCLKQDNQQYQSDTRDEIGRTIYGRMLPDDIQVANALCWFACEEVARAMCD